MVKAGEKATNQYARQVEQALKLPATVAPETRRGGVKDGEKEKTLEPKKRGGAEKMQTLGATGEEMRYIGEWSRKRVETERSGDEEDGGGGMRSNLDRVGNFCTKGWVRGRDWLPVFHSLTLSIFFSARLCYCYAASRRQGVYGGRAWAGYQKLGRSNPLKTLMHPMRRPWHPISG